MPNTEQLLYHTEKSSHQRFSIEMLFLNILLYLQEKTCVKFLRTPVFKNISIQLLLNWFYKVMVWNFVSGLHLNYLDSVTLQKYHSLSNHSFKQNLSYMPSIYLTSALSCKPRFCMFIINGYYKKSELL